MWWIIGIAGIVVIILAAFVAAVCMVAAHENDLAVEKVYKRRPF